MNELTREIVREMVAILIPMLAAWLIAEMTGLVGRLRAWLDSRHQANLSAAVGTANMMLQSAMDNAAGNLALAVRQGRLDPTDLNAVKAWAADAAQAVRGKLPDAIAVTKAADGSVVDGITGKLVDKLPPRPEGTSTLVLRPDPEAIPQDGSFQARASIVVGRLMRDLSLTREQACGVVGNLGQESGLRAIQELRPVSGRGGFGWSQWTGLRRSAFEGWAKNNGMSVTDDEANYGFLIEELRTTEAAALAALRQAMTIEEATQIFEEKYERAGVVAMARRQTFAQQALAA